MRLITANSAAYVASIFQIAQFGLKNSNNRRVIWDYNMLTHIYNIILYSNVVVRRMKVKTTSKNKLIFTA